MRTSTNVITFKVGMLEVRIFLVGMKWGKKPQRMSQKLFKPF